MIIPCPGCMNLFGTSSDCDDCVAYDGNANLEKLQASLRYSHLKPFSQTVTQGFKCPLLRAKDQLRKGSQSFFGTGDCPGCVAWVQWAARYYGPRGQDSLNPVRHALLLGYERSMLHTMQTCPELYVDALANSLRAINRRHDLPDEFTEWFTEALYPDPNDSLKVLPWPDHLSNARRQVLPQPRPMVPQSMIYSESVQHQEAYERVPYEVISRAELPQPPAPQTSLCSNRLTLRSLQLRHALPTDGGGTEPRANWALLRTKVGVCLSACTARQTIPTLSSARENK